MATIKFKKLISTFDFSKFLTVASYFHD
jgi:hypothetical protein